MATAEVLFSELPSGAVVAVPVQDPGQSPRDGPWADPGRVLGRGARESA